MRHGKLFNLLCATMVCAAAIAMHGCSPTRELSVMQFNIWQEGTVVEGGFEAIADEIARLRPDFVTLSEVRNYRGTRFCDRITEALAERGLAYYSFYSYDSGLLSRHPITDSTTIFPCEGDHGSIYKLRTEVDGNTIAVYTGHLDYQNDTYYEVRGYDGNTWERMDAPLTDPSTILERNALSMRDEAIEAFLDDAREEIEAGSMIFFGGDFNEPSHLDWIEETCELADHNGVVIEWPCTSMLADKGFVDAYRQVYPDPVTHPGYTYPSDNAALPPRKITWAPEADERDRIDYIFYYPVLGLTPVEAAIVGPRSSISNSRRITETGQDKFIEPIGVWPTDHKGVFVRFRYRP